MSYLLEREFRRIRTQIVYFTAITRTAPLATRLAAIEGDRKWYKRARTVYKTGARCRRADRSKQETLHIMVDRNEKWEMVLNPRDIVKYVERLYGKYGEDTVQRVLSGEDRHVLFFLGLLRRSEGEDLRRRKRISLSAMEMYDLPSSKSCRNTPYGCV